MFPQVSLNGGNPLIALNQFVNSEMFIVFRCHHLFPNGFFNVFGQRNRPEFPRVVEMCHRPLETVSH